MGCCPLSFGLATAGGVCYEDIKNHFCDSAIFVSYLPAYAVIHTETVEYKDNDITLEGYLAYDDALVKRKVPAVLLVHEWMGLEDYVRGRAKQIAELGYVAFAIDIYGGRRTRGGI